MSIYSTTKLATMALAAVTLGSLLGSACKKDEAQPTPPPPAPEAKKEEAPPPAPPPAPEKPKFTEVPGCQAPESVLYVADGDYYLVSNVNGEPNKADDNGYISKVGADWKMVDEKFIDGAKPDVKLDAPKGSGIRGDKLYVTDITVVRVFDLKTGKQDKDIAIKGATFLNDIAVDGDTIYVSDSGVGGDFKPNGTGAVYSLDKANKITKLAGGDDLGSPNGLLVVDGKLWINTLVGKSIYRLDGGKKADSADLPTGMLDGFAALADGRVVVSSWEGKVIYAGKPGAAFDKLFEDVEAPADLVVDTKHNVLVVPQMSKNQLRVYPLQ
jgi:sugar lactone lactonase YvrE